MKATKGIDAVSMRLYDVCEELGEGDWQWVVQNLVQRRGRLLNPFVR